MYLVQCWIEHPILKIDQTYSYYSNNPAIVEGVRVWIPFHHRKVMGFVDSVKEYNSLEEIEKAIGVQCKEIVEVVDEEALLTRELIDLAKKVAKDTVSPTISCFKAFLPSKLKPSGSAKKQGVERWVSAQQGDFKLTPKQQEAWNWLMEKGEIRYSEFLKSFKTLPRVLVEKGAVKSYEKEKKAQLQEVKTRSNPLSLTTKQEEAKNKMLQSNKRVQLLHGITGSGKTEVYLQMASEVISSGAQVLVLVPEISLTPQMVQRVQKRFGEKVAIYHSGLNDQEKYEQYQLVKRNEVSVVVGTRSSVFMPFEKLGLIILDEEHDSSYKQSSTPAYHCRDIALARAEYWNCKVVLGSATPSLESYARAVKGVYELVELKERINNQLPDIHCIDLKEALRQGDAVLTVELIEALKECMSNKKQAILLLNRRGYHTTLKCNHCQEVLMCKHCDVALNYHHTDRKMKCHHCAAEYDIPKECPACHQKKGFSGFGVGTQKIEELLIQQFPEARIARMDADTTRVKDGHQKILQKFENLEIDILIGTQMIAKGLDFPNVTVVGILNADAGLNRVDYRSVESTFDLIVQASGRSGRSDNRGKVYLQVFNKDHYAVKTALKNDYESFFKQEMNYRYAGQYPPYTYLIAIYFQGQNQERVKTAAWEMQGLLQGNFKVLGPSELNRLKATYRYRILVKGKDLEAMKETVSQVVRNFAQEKSVSMSVDVNPMILE